MRNRHDADPAPRQRCQCQASRRPRHSVEPCFANCEAPRSYSLVVVLLIAARC